MKQVINEFRTKLANAISPEKTHSYPFIKNLKWATPQSENRRILARAHKEFEKEFGRPAIDDAEAWEWDREQLNESLKELGLEPASTEFIPEHFYGGVNKDNAK